jgi:hypothetical protein
MMDNNDQTVLWALQELNDQIERADAAIARADAAIARADAAIARADAAIARTDAAIARTKAAESKLAERDKPCVWTHLKKGWYTGGCNDSIYAGFFKFCPNCGHPVEVHP